MKLANIRIGAAPDLGRKWPYPVICQAGIRKVRGGDGRKRGSEKIQSGGGEMIRRSRWPGGDLCIHIHFLGSGGREWISELYFARFVIRWGIHIHFNFKRVAQHPLDYEVTSLLRVNVKDGEGDVLMPGSGLHFVGSGFWNAPLFKLLYAIGFLHC